MKIETHSGKLLDPLNPKFEDICLEDISISLSRGCRFGGHSKYFYSVLHHSLNCYYESRDRGYDLQTQKMALFHDHSEAYLSDIVTPVKRNLTEYFKIEKSIQDLIYDKYDTWGDNNRLKLVDYDMAVYEARHLMVSKAKDERWELPSRSEPCKFVDDRIQNPQKSKPLINEYFSILEDLGVKE